MADRAPTTITVPDAYGRAKAALAAGDTERATAITQHILRYYPHYLDAYRLLGEIYLERGRPDEASRFFSHVLNADPQSVLAHVGRAIIAEERGQIDSAIDSYERAFEIDPSIAELRGELLRLYTVRYGSAGATIRTTPSGLAYVHLRAGLREAAINELSYVAQVRPDRWDIEVALAEALWRNEQLDEAAAVAGDILAGHAACVKCNWMLGYIHWTNGRTERARPYLMEAVAADPTYRIAQSIWETTPWPLDREIIRAQPAVVPAWSAQELASGDLDLTLPFAGLPETPAGAAPERSPAGAGPGPGARPSRDWSRGRPAGAPTTPLPEISAPRITQPFGPRPPLPDEHPAAADAAPDLAGEDRLGAPGESGAADTLPVPAPLAEPLDLDWLDEWASETAIPAAAAPAAPGAATEAGLPAAELTPDQIAAPREPADAPPAVPAGDDLPAAPPPAADAPAAAAPAAPGAATEAGLPVAELAPDQIATPREPADAPPAVPAGDEPPAALPLAADAPAARAPSAPPAATKASLPAARLSPDQIAGLSEDQLLDWLSSIAAAPVVEDGVAAAAPPAVAPDSRAADSIPVEDFTHDELLEWLAKTAPVTGDVDRIPDQESTLPAGAPPGEETTPAAPGENGEQDQKKTSQNGAEVGYNHTIQDESDSARALVTAEEDAFATHATSEEDQMAPSYKEDDDQERQFDFDWDRDALPDYLKPFLTDDAAAQGAAPAASAPAPTIPPAPPPAANAGGLPDWLREGSAPGAPAPGSGQPFNFGASASPPQPPPQSAGFAPGRPASPPPPAPQNSPPPAGPGSQPAPSAPPPAAGMADFDFGDIKPFDFGATSGGEFDFNSDSLPSWLGSAPAPAAAPAPQEVMLGRPLAGDRTPDPALDSPEMPDWLRTPAPPAAAAPPPAPAPAASAEFDFGSDTLPSWLGGGAATSPPAAARPPAPAMPPPAAPAPTEFDLGSLQPFDFGGTPAPPAAGGGKSTADEFDFGDIQPFDFGAAGAAAAPAAAPGGRAPGGFDLGAVQPFDFGPAPAPPAAQSAATPAAAPADDFDFGNIQPFDFGGTAPAPAPAAQPADGGEVDDFIDFLSVGNASPSLAAAPEAPAGADFDLDLQPFSFEGLDLGPAAPSAPPAPPSGRAPTGEPAWGRAAGAPPSRLPADPRPEEMAGLTGDEFSFEPFMFDQGGGSAAGHAPATPAPALPGAPPPAPFSFGPDQPGGAMNETGLPPGLEDLPDLKPFSFEGMEMAGDLGSGFETASQAQAFGRRATDRPESGRPPMPFGFEDESSADVGDIHNFSWQRPAAQARATPQVPEAPETSGSIFAKARKRKEELEQTLRREAEARGEVYQPTPAAAPALPPEEAAELTYWPSLEEDVASPAPEATPGQPFDFNALGIPSTVDVAQDMASLQLSPFEFGDESHAPALAPSAGAGPPSLLQDTGTPTVEFSVPTGDSPAAAPTTAQVPAAPEPAAPSTAGELLWSIPVTGSEPAAAPAAGATGLDAVDHGFGEEVAPGQFDFTGLPQIDLGSLDLTPEERAYLMGEPGAAADMTTAELPAAAGVPELSLMDTDLTSASTAPIQPFSFDPAAFEAPAPAADATAGTAAAMAEATDTGPAAVQPFSFAEEPAAGPEAVQPFSFAEEPAAGPEAVQPFSFAEEPAAGPEAVQPFSFAEEPTAGPEAVQPFSFDIPAGPEEAAVQPFSFDRPAAPALSTPLPAATPPEPRFHIDTPPAPPPTPFGAAAGEVSPLAAESWAETPGAGAFDFSGVQMEPLAAETETTAAATPAVEAEAAPSRPVPTTPPAAIAPAAPPAARAVEPVAPVAATPAPAAPAAVPAPPPLAATPAPPVLASGSMDDLLRQLKENPTDAATRLALAIGYEQRDDYPRAAEQYRELIKGRTVPTNVLDIVTGNLRELVESQAENPTLHRLLGDAYMKQGLFQMAISQYNWLLTKGVR